ncbi:MAG: carbon-nitrogen hydrolase family protein [Gammaproteobacteria bacterium]
MNVQNKCIVAAVQMTSTADIDDNLTEARRLMKKAAQAGARLVVLPENFACMPLGEKDRLAMAETPGDGPIQSFLSDCAREMSLFLVGGTIPLRLKNGVERPAQTCLYFGSDGSQLARYDKIHLFDVCVSADNGRERYCESDYTTPGTDMVLADSPAGRLGFAVCYDLRFPGFFRGLLDGGMQVAVLPSAFTQTTGRAHWEILLRARAVENQIWVVAAAQGGRHANGRRTFGHSMIVDPWGEVVSLLADGPGIVIGEIDLDRETRLRREFPILQHRKSENWKMK